VLCECECVIHICTKIYEGDVFMIFIHKRIKSMYFPDCVDILCGVVVKKGDKGIKIFINGMVKKGTKKQLH